MRKALGATLFLLVSSIACHADSTYTANFQCTGTCTAAVPIGINYPIVFNGAGTPVSVLWEGEELDFTLPGQDLPGDTYTWAAYLDDYCPFLVCSSYPVQLILDIGDSRTGYGSRADWSGAFPGSVVTSEVVDGGTLAFSDSRTPTPEPNSTLLLCAGLLGIGALRKKFAH